jgi:two-component sensor histidine kinase
LTEKEYLMKELNHRVANNLAIITSLINLKNRTLGDSVDLSDLEHQINAIRIVHEKLYQGDDFTRVDMKEYMYKLVYTLFSSLMRKHPKIEVNFDDIFLNATIVGTIGLIVNEIAINAVKYGFTSEEEKRFSVKMKIDGGGKEYILTISNSGRPFPENVDLDNPETLGLQLISSLTGQLNGSIELRKTPYPIFTIRFPKMAG